MIPLILRIGKLSDAVQAGCLWLREYKAPTNTEHTEHKGSIVIYYRPYTKYGAR